MDGATDREGPALVNDHVVWPAAWDVAILLVVQDSEARVVQAIEAATRMVPPSGVHLVSDGAPDSTVDVARGMAVQVVETMGRLGRAGAARAGIQAFRLAEGFEFVLVLDVDTRLEPHYLEHAMPLFSDPEVVAVDGQADARRQTKAYQRLARGKPVDLAGVLPGTGRIYRSTALRRLETVDHVAATFEIYRKALGKVVFCPTARLSGPAGPATDPVEPATDSGEPETGPATDPADPATGSAAGPGEPATDPVVLWPARLRPAAMLAWFALVIAVTGVLVRVALTATVLPASRAEPALVDAAYGNVAGLGASPVDGSLTVTGLQLNAFADVTSAFDRHVNTLTSAREMSVVAALVMLAGLILMTTMLRVRPWVTAICVAVLAVSGPVVVALTPAGPAVPAAAWFTVAAAAAFAAVVRPNGALILAGLIALALSVATVPILVVPLGFGVAYWAFTRQRHRVRTVGATLVVTGGATFLFWNTGLLSFQELGLLDAAQRTMLLTILAAAALAGAFIRWMRPVAAGLGAGLLLAAFGADALLPVLLVVAAILMAVAIDDTVSRPTVAWVPAAAAVAGSVAGAFLVPASAPPVDHNGLTSWAVGHLDTDTRLVAPAGLWSDLARDRSRAGLPATGVRRTGSPDDLVVGAEASGGVVLARFPGLAVSTSDDTEILAERERAAAGTQLAANFRLHTTDSVLTALRSGRVDMRLMTVLAELCRDNEVTVVRTAKPGAERDSALPDRMVTLSTADPVALRDWLAAQQAPFAPAVTELTPDGVTVGWRLPASRNEG